MATVKVKGLIVRQTNFGDSDRIFTLISSELGSIQVMAKGVRQRKTALSCCHIFIYGEFVLYEGRSMYYMNAVDIEHDFFGLSANLENFALACYIADLSETGLQEYAGDRHLVSLLLNSLYLLEQEKHDVNHIKTVFEWRFMKYAGYSPRIDECATCHTTQDLRWFSIKEGCLYCEKCGEGRLAVSLNDTLYGALYYILTAPDNRAFSFHMNRDMLLCLGKISEDYVCYHIKTENATLDYFHEVTG